MDIIGRAWYEYSTGICGCVKLQCILMFCYADQSRYLDNLSFLIFFSLCHCFSLIFNGMLHQVYFIIELIGNETQWKNLFSSAKKVFFKNWLKIFHENSLKTKFLTTSNCQVNFYETLFLNPVSTRSRFRKNPFSSSSISCNIQLFLTKSTYFEQHGTLPMIGTVSRYMVIFILCMCM